MFVDARSHGTSVSKTAAFIKCSRADVVEVFKSWIVEHERCVCQRLVKASAERRVQENTRETMEPITKDQGFFKLITEHNVHISYGI